MSIMVTWACDAGIAELVKRMVDHKFDFDIKFAGPITYLVSRAITWSLMEIWLVEIREQVRTNIYPEMAGL